MDFILFLTLTPYYFPRVSGHGHDFTQSPIKGLHLIYILTIEEYKPTTDHYYKQYSINSLTTPSVYENFTGIISEALMLSRLKLRKKIRETSVLKKIHKTNVNFLSPILVLFTFLFFVRVIK